MSANARRRPRRGAQPVPVRGVLSQADLESVQDAFGVDESQVRRDHVISHCLAALSAIDDRKLVFFGGTALSRTHLPALRLSEDIDLIAMDNRGDIARDVQSVLVDRLRPTIGSPEFEPSLAQTSGSEAAVMRVAGVRIQIQLVSSRGFPDWPTEVSELHQRYADAPSTQLRVPTGAAFVASKLMAWHDRRASRDLYDLWALAVAGKIDTEALTLFERLGQLTDATRVSFVNIPSESKWKDDLAHQGRVRVSPAEAASVLQWTIAGGSRPSS